TQRAKAVPSQKARDSRIRRGRRGQSEPSTATPSPSKRGAQSRWPHRPKSCHDGSMAQTRCPRCGASIADTASACVACARPVTLDVTARVPKRPKRASRKLFWRDAVLLAGGAGGIACASTSESWWLAGGIVVGSAAIAAVLHYTHEE